MRLEPGMLIKTNYSGPYRIVSVGRGCTCPSYVDHINSKFGKEAPARPPHIHITCTRPDGTGQFWLGGYDEDTLLSLDKSYCGHKTELGHDWITVLEDDEPIQITMF